MTVIVTTKSGSKYTLDDRAFTWRRENPRGWAWDDTEDAGGALLAFPEIVIGEPMFLQTVGGWGEFMTTPVTNFENSEV